MRGNKEIRRIVDEAARLSEEIRKLQYELKEKVEFLSQICEGSKVNYLDGNEYKFVYEKYIVEQVDPVQLYVLYKEQSLKAMSVSVKEARSLFGTVEISKIANKIERKRTKFVKKDAK